jgi:hypothetical protein
MSFSPVTRVFPLLAACASLAPAGVAFAQLRVLEWNVTNWSSDDVSARGAAFQTAIYGVVPAGLTLAGQSLSPDVIILQEIEEGAGTGGTAAVNAFVNLLNTASGSPGDWVAAPYVFNQGDTGNALLYRSSKITNVGPTITLGTLGVDVGSGATQSPRDNQRWRVRLAGYSAAAAELYIYSGHFKAGSLSSDQARREPEGLRIREDANALPAGAHFLLGADMNVQSSTQVAYDYLTGTSAAPGDIRQPSSGRFFDPINRPGTWENNVAFRNIHTQEPSSAMDSRHDQILISASLRDGAGLSYLPAQAGGSIFSPFRSPGANPGQEWFDPNHSYRAWGNDGESYNAPLRTGANTQVGSAIAQALITSVAGGGHLPVYLDLQVPAKLGAPTGTINFGTVAQGSTATQSIQITNAANIAFSRTGNGWGIEPLNFTFTPTAGFSVVGGNGPFVRTATAPPAAATTFTISMNTAAVGPVNGTLTIASNDPDVPTRVLTLSGTVEAAGGPPTGSFDVNGNGVVNTDDLYAWYAGIGARDCNNDGSVTIADAALLRAFLRYDEIPDITAGRR